MDHRKPSIVMKLGAENCEVGLSCDSAPRASIRTLVGRPIAKGGPQADLRDHYIGNEAEFKEALLHLRRPMRRGRVDSWDDMILVWQHAFREALRVDPEEHPVLISEQPLVPQVNREKMTQVLFETFKVPQMYVAQQPLLTLLSVGKTQGLVIDSGLEVTYAVPIYEGYLIREGIRRVDLGGLDLSSRMEELLQKRGIVTEYASHLVHKLCYVASDFSAELKRPELKKTIQLPDSQMVTIGEERVLVPEGFFKPSLLGSETMALPKLASEAIFACTPEVRGALAREVVLSGGPTRLPGLAPRLERELERRLGGLGAEVRGHETGLRPSAWLGGAIFAELSSFQDMWITRQDYEEHGPTIVHKKCDIV